MRFLILLPILLLSACATGAAFNNAALPKPSKGSAQLVIYRPSSLSGALESPTVVINGNNVCDISIGSYFTTQVKPGKSKIIASQYGGSVRSSLSANFDAGKRYYVKIEPNLAKSLSGGFGIAGTLAHDAIADDSGVYQLRVINNDMAEEEILSTKQSCQ